MKKGLFFIATLFVGLSVWGQNPEYFSSGDFYLPNNWDQNDASKMSNSIGNTFRHITQAVDDDTSNRYFRFYSATSNGTTYEPNGQDDIQISIESSIDLEVSGNGKAYYIVAANTTDNYVFKTIGSGSPGTSKLVAFEVQGEVRDVVSVSNPQTIAPGSDQVITTDLSGVLYTGQGVYLRYTNDDWATSTIVSMSFSSGSTYLATIPASVNTDNKTVKYYVFTSGDNLTFGSGAGEIPVSDADLYTISFNNNSGDNYQYRVSDQVDWANLEFPASGTISAGGSYIVGAKVYESDLTALYEQAPEIQCWFGYSSSDTNPNTWENWFPATYFASYGDNDEYQLNLGTHLPTTPGTYYYASRFSLNRGTYQYGGYNNDNGSGGKGGFWGETTSPGGLHVSGVVHVLSPAEINVIGNSNNISGDGTNVPSTDDDTDFGNIDYGSGSITHTFTIQNLGESELTINSISLSNTTDFSFTNPASPIFGNSSSPFTVTFNPESVGAKMCTVTISNTDGDEGSYTFNIQGNGISNVLNWVNLEGPESGVIATSYTAYDVKARVYEPGVTDESGQGAGITCWIGVNESDTNPNTWTQWYEATYTADAGNDDEYTLNLGQYLPYGTYYYASRFEYNDGTYQYGGYNDDNGSGGHGGFWGQIYNGAPTYSGIVQVGDAYSIVGEFNSWTRPGVKMYTLDGTNYFLTYTITAGGLKFLKNGDYVNGWGGCIGNDQISDFPSGITNGGDNIPAVAGTYYITLDISTNAYNFQLISDCSSTKIWTGGSWIPSTPSSTDIAILAGDYNTGVNGDLDVCSLSIVNPFAELTIEGGNYVKVNHAITNYGNVTVAHEGSLVQVNDAAVNSGLGTYQIKKTTGAYFGYDYIYWSSPLFEAPVGSVFPTTGADAFPDYRFTFKPENYLDESKGHGYPQPESGSDGYDDNGDDWNKMNDNTLMPSGLGISIMGKGSVIPFDPAHINDTFTSYDVSFEGSKINNGSFTAEVRKDLFSGFDGYNNNLNFLGNPYPSAIDVFELYHDNDTKMDGNFYFWTHNKKISNLINGPNTYEFSNSSFAIGTITGTYGSYNYTQVLDGSSVTPTRYIASCQGLMVSMRDDISDPSTITYKNSQRVAGNNTAFLNLNDKVSDIDRFWLNMTNSENVFRQIAIGFDETTSDDYSQGDAPRIDSADDTDFYSLVPNNNGHFAIQFLGAFADDKQVPLGVEINQAGSYNIAVDTAEGVFANGQKIYLEDTYTDIIHDLSFGAYTFTAEAATNVNDRFVLRFVNETASTPESALANLKIYPNPAKDRINIAYSGMEDLEISLYDSTGKLIFQKNNANVINLSNFAHGWYIIKVSTASGNKTQKILID